MVKGIDTATRLTFDTATKFKQAGYAFVGRYLVPPKIYTYKSLTAAEAKAITDAGLRLLTVWETTDSRPQGGYSAGIVDGMDAKKCAEDIGMPTSGIIYFAVDFEATNNDIPKIKDYFKGVRQTAGEYGIGVYGSYKVVEAMRDTGLCKAYWQCVGWSYGKKSSARNIYQAQWNQKISGVYVDINECDDMDKAGIWTYFDGKGEESTVFERRYDTVDSLPAWAKPTITELIHAGHLRGSGDVYDANGYPADLNLSYDMLRLLVILDRAGTFNRK